MKLRRPVAKADGNDGAVGKTVYFEVAIDIRSDRLPYAEILQPLGEIQQTIEKALAGLPYVAGAEATYSETSE